MKRKLFSLAVCLLLLTGLLSFFTTSVKSASGDGIAKVDVPPRGTFLHAIDGYPYHGAGDREYNENLELWEIIGSYYSVEDPAIVDLNAEGFNEGDKIIITYTAGVYYSGTYNPTNPDASGWPLRDQDNLFWGGLLGIFSTSSSLLEIKQNNRVPGAVDSGTAEFTTPPTKWGEDFQDISDKLAANGIRWYTGPEPTDIPNDFLIRKPHEGYEMTIPRNARFLFLCCIDDLYYDNLGEIKVTIEKDTDLDGLPDHWEINGIDFDEDGTVDLDLSDLDADWEHKDIFLEVDYMSTHRPNQGAIDDVVDAFANAPVTNPDGVNGINLHVLIDDEIPFQDLLNSWAEYRNIKAAKFGTEDERRNINSIKAKKMVYRYCLSVHQTAFTSSVLCPGVSEGIPSDDFIVAFGAFSDGLGSREDQAAVFMHELGHTLGLHHGGRDNINFKPNYLSIMNYAFQYNDWKPERPLDYSRKALATLNENSLNENAGIGELTRTVWRGPDNTLYINNITLNAIAIDWNKDDNLTAGLIINLNNHPDRNYPSAAGENLTGFNDWENLVYRFRGLSFYAESAIPDYHDELTTDIIELMEEDAKTIVEVSIPGGQNSNVAVEEGDWMEYSASHTGSPPDSETSKFRMNVDQVNGTEITVSADGENLKGEEWSMSDTYNLATGFHDYLIIPSGLDVEDQFYHEAVGLITIQGSEKYAYAGEERTIVWSTVSGNTLHWDKETGILCQADWRYSDYETRWVLDKTSLWGQIDVFLIAGLSIAIIGFLLVIILVFRRKKKKHKAIETTEK